MLIVKGKFWVFAMTICRETGTPRATVPQLIEFGVTLNRSEMMAVVPVVFSENELESCATETPRNRTDPRKAVNSRDEIMFDFISLRSPPRFVY